MAGFKRAQAEQAAIKMGIYGPSGSGKSFTSLLVAEGLAKATGKRIAYVDTERGTDFYCKAVPERSVHPGAFDFDALYTRSVTEAAGAIKALSPDEYGVIVVDSITHIWEACINAYGGKTTRIGSIPVHAWPKIKKPYKDLMNLLLGSPMHVVFCGRQANEYETDPDTDEMRRVGVKMKAEGETSYEPHILLRMEAEKNQNPGAVAKVRALVEKDRTGVLAGRVIESPTFADLGEPILRLLGETQAAPFDEDAAAHRDAMAIDEEAANFERVSEELRDEFRRRIKQAGTAAELDGIADEVKARQDKFTTEDLKLVKYDGKIRRANLKGGAE